jgi:hypothetical protein
LTSAMGGAMITALGAVVLGFINHRSTSRQVARQYKFDQRKELRDKVAHHHGLLVDAAESLRSRARLIYGCQDLALDSTSDLDRYYVESTAMRLLHLTALAIRFESTAVFFDRRVAGEEGLFLTYAKAIRWVICDPFLDREDANPGDDPTNTGDWFYTDRLKDMSNRVFEPDGTLLGLEKFQADCNSQKPTFLRVVRFIEGLNTADADHRWDRFVALDLVTMAFLNRFGYRQDHSCPSAYLDVAAEVRQPRVHINLHKWLLVLKLDEYREGRVLCRALRAQIEKSDLRNELNVPWRTRLSDSFATALMKVRKRKKGATESVPSAAHADF